MATVIPVDEFITDEWYPGFKPGYTHAPWYIDPVQTFRKEDEENFWFLDFHWPRGLTPMGLIWNEDGYNWSSQLAAEQMPLPPGRGITCRLGGTHTYGSPLPVTDVREIGQRAKRLERMLPPFLQNFDEIWGHMREEVNESWDYFSGVDHSALSLADLRENLVQARQYHKRAFEIHFEVMYPLLANYVGFYSMCTELGLDPGQIGKFLQGYDTKIMETDRELWKLTTAARRAGLEQVFAAHEADGIPAALAAHGGSAGTWLTQFDDFLQVYGWRTEGSCDIALPSWIEDPTPALGTIKTFLLKDTDHDFEKARNAAVEEREAAVDAARSTLTWRSRSSSTAAWPPAGRRTSRGGRTTTTTTSTCASRSPCGGPARPSRTGSARTTRTTRCTCSGKRSWTCRPAASRTRNSAAWSSSASSTSTTGWSAGRACPRWSAPSRSRSTIPS